MIDTDSLASRGFAVAPGLIGPDQCRALAALWPDKARFRSHVIMQRHGYGQGEYQYFTYPLPGPVEKLRQALYPELANIANRWNEQLGRDKRFPDTLGAGCGSATKAARSGRRRCCCAMDRATTTACTATSTASWCSRCRRPCC